MSKAAKEYLNKVMNESLDGLFVVRGKFLGRPMGSLSKAMSRDEAESFFNDLKGRKYLGVVDASIEPASSEDEVWNGSEAKKSGPNFDKASSYLKDRDTPIDEAAGSTTLPGIRAVRQDMGLDETDTSKDDEIRNMSFKEYLGRYLSWEGIIGYTSTIAAIADAFKK
jgi:hypothetical protein